MNTLLRIAALAEAATGLALLASPAFITQWLFGSAVSDAGTVVGRVAGIALLSLGAACWPVAAPAGALAGMLVYSSFAGVYLLYLGIEGNWVGALLWPAVVVHAVLTALLAREF